MIYMNYKLEEGGVCNLSVDYKLKRVKKWTKQ